MLKLQSPQGRELAFCSRRAVFCRTLVEDVPLSPKPEVMMNGISRAAIKPGAHVKVVQKMDQRSGKLTEGIVKNILTNAPVHPHGIKVRLESGIVGRVKELLGS
jgi:uncharacterized repeat protein (TIGR03833 family)